MTEDVFIIPTSLSQQRLWLLEQLDPGAALNMSAAVRLTGALDIAALHRALNEVVRRHESLRTTFIDEGGEPMQVIAEHLDIALPLSEVDHEDDVRRLAAEDAQRPFDLAEGPLLRASLLRLAPERHVLLVTMHHIISDGWSIAVFIRELTALYRAYIAYEPSPLKELPIQYADFALWQREWLRGAVLENAIDYWKQQLAGAPPVLELPTDRVRPAVQSYRGDRHRATLPPHLVDGLRRLSRAEGVTLFMTLLAAFKLLLYRHTGQDDIVVGTPVAGRTREEVERLIGFFINTLALRTKLEAGLSFRELLRRVREVTLGAYAHQELPFERLVEELQPARDLSRTPIFQVYFNMLNFPDVEIDLPGLSVGFLAAPEVESKFDMTLYIKEESEGLQFELIYNADLFAPERMAETLRQYLLLLGQIAEQPDKKLIDFSLVTDTARHVLPDPSATLDASWRGAVHTIFSEHARRVPGNLAVADQHETWTYEELDARSNQLAHYLRTHDIGRGDTVAIYAHRSATLVNALLGVMKSGGAFVILDPAYPAARLIACLDVARPKGLLQIAEAGPLPAELEKYFDASRLRCRLVLSPRAETEGALSEYPTEAPDVEVGANDMAYVAFTSGSTGVPKGVIGRHGSLTHFTPWTAHTFGLGDSDRFSMLSGLAHDPLHRDIFNPLQLGASVIIPDPAEVLIPGRMAQWMRQQRITVANLTPAMAQLLTETASLAEEVLIDSLHHVFFVGDVLTRRDVRRLRKLAPSVTCINYYGATETQRALSFFIVPEETEAAASSEKEIVPLGRGVPDVQLLVLNESRRLAGVGELGEIYLRSPHLAGGYLGDEPLTAERFITNPWTNEENDRIYRTGDLGRYRPDGIVEPLGRTDLQVNIRSFRIELGEIEAALGKHPLLQEAVVVAREAVDGDCRLIGYVVLRGAEPLTQQLEQELRVHLKKLLPDYMVPATFVLLETLPLTPNGKLDRRALPAPGELQAKEFNAPRTPVEELLASIWSSVLGTTRVGIDENFFELGGHSLLATQVLARIRQAFGIELPLRALFESPTVAGVATYITEVLRSDAPAATNIIPKAQLQELPLSFAQQRLWFLDQLEPGNAFYNVGAAVRLSGRLDFAALLRSLREIIARHDVLRTTFIETDGHPLQRVATQLEPPLEVVDLRALPAVEREREARRLASLELRSPFNLARGPLFKLKLLQLDEESHVILVVMHHIISDGWSSGIFVRELAACYEAFAAGREAALPPLLLQYADYAAWQRDWLKGETLEREIAYWRERLGHAPSVLELPTDRPRPAELSYRGTRFHFELDQELTHALKELARREESTVYMVLLAAYSTLLYRYTEQDDLTIGTPMAGRNAVETEGLIGFFANTLVLRTDLSGDPSFRELLRRVREVTLGAYAYQNVPFEMLVDQLQPARSLSHTPLFQVALTLQNAPAAQLAIEGLELSPLEIESDTAKFDLLLTLQETSAGLQSFFEYSTDLFDAATVERMAAHFCTLLESLIANPDEKIARLQLLPQEEHRQLVGEWAGERKQLAPRECLHELFEQQAARTPESIAVTDDQGEWTYGVLNARANRLARRLVEAGVRPDTVVGVMFERSAQMVLGLLAVLKAGGAYLPLNPRDPQERLSFMLADAKCKVLLTEQSLRDNLPEHDCQIICAEDGVGNEENLGVNTTPANLAYVIYTSGSTGRPKGVAVTHADVARLFDATEHLFGFDELDVWTMFHSYTFDFSVWEMWGALLYGGRLVIVPYWVSRSPESFYELVCREQVTVLNQTPSAFRHFILAAQNAPDLKPSLRAVIFGGEALESRSLVPWIELYGDERPRLSNMYGITETTVHVTYQRLLAKDVSEAAASLIGRPIPDLEVYVLDNKFQPVPTGVRGELYVGGAGLARGYLNRPDLTAERFIPNPFANTPGARLYKTGDLARFRADGTLEYLGRIDHQVKVRGFRIELGEIETALTSHQAVNAALVMAVDKGSGAKTLVAYLATGNAPAPSVAELHAHLKELLPSYMVPHAFVMLDTLPLTANGKIDRKTLLALEATPEPSDGRSAAPRNEVEQMLVKVWEEVLGVANVGIDDNFFELGGDSILSIQIVSKARQAGINLTAKQIFQEQTIAGLAALVGTTSPAIRISSADVHGPVPLTPIQRWFFEQNHPELNHYNQSVMLESATALDHSLLEEAFRQLLGHHDALRLRYAREDTGWQQFAPGPENTGTEVKRIDLTAVPESEQHELVEREVAAAQAGLHLEHGPLVRVLLFDWGLDRPAQLLIVIHHLVVDGVSWRVLLEDLRTAYSQLSRGERVTLPPKTTSFKQWSEHLQEYVRKPEMADEARYWLTAPREETCRLAALHAAAAGTFGTARTAKASLDSVTTTALLQDVPAAYGTQINDALLAALALTIRRSCGTGALHVDLEGHGREDLFAQLDVSRTVGWFTSQFPVWLDTGASNGPAALRIVKEQLRKVPQHGIGYGLLRYLSGDEEVADKLRRQPQAQIRFNYLGQFDQLRDTHDGFSVLEDGGASVSAGAPLSHLIDVNCRVIDGCLETSWRYDENSFAAGTVEQMAAAYTEELQRLVDQCRDTRARIYTPSDFPLANLDQSTLAELLNAHAPVEDIYPLSQLQQGLLFHTLQAPRTDMYFLHLSCRFEGPLDEDAFRRAWQAVVSRHTILRTGFVWQGLAEPLQVVHERAELPWEIDDWRELSEHEHEARLATYLRENRARGFDLKHAPLTRMALFKLRDDLHHFIWSSHHLVLDGWSYPILIREVLDHYDAYSTGRDISLPPARPFRDYIAWLRGHALTDARNYWRERLRGFNTPTPVGSATPLRSTNGHDTHTILKLRLTPDETRSLRAFARAQQLTLNTLVRGAWALWLGSGEDRDVVFGTVVSGRPAELEGAVSMVGLLINTLPVRVRSGNGALLDWLREIQDQQIEMQQYEYSPLVEVQQLSDMPRSRPLFESIVSFLNYPVHDAVEQWNGSVRVRDLEFLERVNYPLALVAGARGELELELKYDRRRFDDADITHALELLRRLLAEFIARPQAQLGELRVFVQEASRRRQEARHEGYKEARRRMFDSVKRKSQPAGAGREQ